MRYRIVVADSRMQRDGRFLENLGNYDPQANPKKFIYSLDRIAYWLSRGAKPSETVDNLLKQDRAYEKIAASSTGEAPEGPMIERLPERKRKAKPKQAKKSA